MNDSNVTASLDPAIRKRGEPTRSKTTFIRLFRWSIALIIAIIGLGFLLPTVGWDGGTRATIRIRLKAGTTPVRNAKIQIFRQEELRNPSVHHATSTTTDTNGLATITIHCGAGGGTFLFFKTGSFLVNHELRIENSGSRSVITPLSNVLGKQRWPLSKREFDLNLQLIPDQRPLAP